MWLQQCLPFTVLKLRQFQLDVETFTCVATVLTVHGIETQIILQCLKYLTLVATVLTVHGIETMLAKTIGSFNSFKLQQCLPFTVLKLMMISFLLFA